MRKPINRVIKIKVGTGSRILKHAFIGSLFSMINELSYRFFNHSNDQKNEILLSQDKEIKELNEIFFRKEEIFKNIDENFHLIQHDRKSEFLKNFFYGSVIVFFGIETTRYIRTFSFIKGASTLQQILIGIPIAIIPYYAFCCFYDRKTIQQFSQKLKRDFIPLGIVKYLFDISQAGYAERIKNIVMKNSKSFSTRMRRATWMLVVFNTIWIFLLTSFYHERISFNLPNKTKLNA